jgi:hypothetical protein
VRIHKIDKIDRIHKIHKLGCARRIESALLGPRSECCILILSQQNAIGAPPQNQSQRVTVIRIISSTSLQALVAVLNIGNPVSNCFSGEGCTEEVALGTRLFFSSTCICLPSAQDIPGTFLFPFASPPGVFSFFFYLSQILLQFAPCTILLWTQGQARPLYDSAYPPHPC